MLGSSLDPEETLQRVAQLVVPRMADWCAIELPDEKGALQQVALAHVDPALLETGRAMRERWPPQRDAPSSPYEVLRTGAAQLLAEVPDELLEAARRRPGAARGGARARPELGRHRADDRARPHARRDVVRLLRERPPLRGARHRLPAGARGARRDGDRERPALHGALPGRAHAPGQPAPGAAARRAGLALRRRLPARASAAPRSAATSTTRSRSPAGTWCCSAT